MDYSRAGELLPDKVQFRYYQYLDSTNLTALAQDWPQFTVVAADSQGSGRGRLGRSWASPPAKNLYFSMVFRPDRPRDDWGSFSLAAGVAVARAIGELSLEPGLKWPNDVLLTGKKTAGVLCEAKNEKLVAGIGVNVNQTDFPEDLAGKATSLRHHSGRVYCRSQLLARMVVNLLDCYSMWRESGFSGVAPIWSQYDSLLGKRIAVRRGEVILDGLARGVNAAGELVLETCGGQKIALCSGDVSLQNVYE